jgi:pimeloyl-ACP methyl ester carboxylesterase
MLPILSIAAGVAVAAGLLYQRRGAVRDARTLPAPGRLVDIGGGRRLHLHCAGAGAGPTVVLDAGIAASSLSWSRVQPEVAAFARVCSYDRGGLAWSDPGRRVLSAGRLADDLHALLAAAGIPQPYVLVGHSFGSFVIRMFAARYPEAVSGLVLVDPIYASEFLTMPRAGRRRIGGGVFLSHVGSGLARVGVVRACLNLLERGSTRVPRGVSRAFGADASTTLTRLVGEVRKLPVDVWPAVRAHWSQPKCFTAMARHLRALGRSATEIARSEGPLAIPLTVITAASQPDTARAEHARLAALSSEGRQIISSHAGHWVHLDDPGTVVAAVRAIVDRCRVSGSSASQ